MDNNDDLKQKQHDNRLQTRGAQTWGIMSH